MLRGRPEAVVGAVAAVLVLVASIAVVTRNEEDGAEVRAAGSTTTSSSSSSTSTSVLETTTTSAAPVTTAAVAGPATTKRSTATTAVAVAADRPGLYVVRRDGSGLRRLVASGIGRPSWAPDSARLAFTCDQTQSKLCIVGADGKGLKQFDVQHTGGLGWSPDGRTIALPTGDSTLKGLDPDTGAFTEIGPANSRLPTWARDGRLVFIVQLQSSAELHVRSTDGSDRIVTTLTRTSTAPRFSPDGVTIAYGTMNQVFAVSPDGANKRALSDACCPSLRSLSWSVDSRRVAFDEGANIAAAAADGAGRQVLLADASGPEYSPDGALIAAGGRTGEIVVANADGSGRRVLLHPSGGLRANVGPWSPDGAFLSFTISPPAPG